MPRLRCEWPRCHQPRVSVPWKTYPFNVYKWSYRDPDCPRLRLPLEQFEAATFHQLLDTVGIGLQVVFGRPADIEYEFLIERPRLQPVVQVAQAVLETELGAVGTEGNVFLALVHRDRNADARLVSADGRVQGQKPRAQAAPGQVGDFAEHAHDITKVDILGFDGGAPVLYQPDHGLFFRLHHHVTVEPGGLDRQQAQNIAIGQLVFHQVRQLIAHLHVAKQGIQGAMGDLLDTPDQRNGVLGIGQVLVQQVFQGFRLVDAISPGYTGALRQGNILEVRAIFAPNEDGQFRTDRVDALRQLETVFDALGAVDAVFADQYGAQIDIGLEPLHGGMIGLLDAYQPMLAAEGFQLPLCAWVIFENQYLAD